MNTSESVWNEYHHKLSIFIKSRVNQDDVDDILQDIFIKVHKKIDTLEDFTKLESWLYQITRNSIIDYYRSRKIADDLPDWVESPQPEEGASPRRELASCLIPLIDQLPEKYRRAIRISEIEGKSQNELAELEDISISGAKSRVQRGRALLRSMLHDCCLIETNHKNQLISYQQVEQDCKICQKQSGC